MIPDRVVWHQAVGEEADVSWSGHGLRFSSDHRVILRSVEVLIEPPGKFCSLILQLRGLRIRMQIQNLHVTQSARLQEELGSQRRERIAVGKVQVKVVAPHQNVPGIGGFKDRDARSEEHTSELQS